MGFNAKTGKDVKAAAKSLGVDIRSYNIIYQLLDDARALMAEQLPRIVTTTVIGAADVLARFEIIGPNKQPVAVAGCRVKEGQLMRSGIYRVIRNTKQIFEGVRTQRAT